MNLRGYNPYILPKTIIQRTNKMKTINKVLIFGGICYGAATFGFFTGASTGLTEVRNHLGDRVALDVSNGLLEEYSNLTTPAKVLKFGEYLSYNLYRKNLTEKLNHEGKR